MAGKPLGSQAQLLVLNLLTYFQAEKDNEGPLLPLNSVNEEGTSRLPSPENENTNFPESEEETYEQREGTKDDGHKYEKNMLALYALRLSLNKDVKDVSIMSNVEGFGALDDIIMRVEYYAGRKQLYLIQLKYRGPKKVSIRESELINPKSKLFLGKYKESYKELSSEGHNLIKDVAADQIISCLVINAKLPNISTITLKPSHICHLVSNPIQNLQEDCIDTKSKNFFTFNIQSPSTKEELEYSTFFRHFRFYDKQVNCEEAENEIVRLLETSFGVKNPEITKTFIRFIEAECEGKRRLTKKNVKIKLLELLTGVTEEMLLFRKYETFKDITDLNNYDERVKILKEISISLQGRTAVNLYDLTNKSIHETVSVSFLLKNIKETVNVGSKFLKRPDNYIERRFYKILLKQNILWKTTKIIFLLDTPSPPALTGKIKIFTDLQTNNFLSCRITDENLAVIVSNPFSETIKYIQNHRDLKSFSLLQVKVHDAWYLEWQRSWFIQEDLSKFIVYGESVKEEEILKYFKSNLNVVSAIPGMGKTTILNTLAHYCEPNMLALKLDLREREEDLRNEDSELRQNPLNYICKRMHIVENSEIEKKLFKHLKEENRLILFVDAFDEISPTHSNAVLSIIEKLKENQIPTWIFTRPLVISILQKHFSIIPFNMVPLGKDDIKNYLIQTVGEERDEEVDSSLTDNVLNLCSAPFYLDMFAAIIREKQVNLRDLKMTDLYEHFTDMSFKKHTKKLNVNENANYFINFMKYYKQYYMDGYKTAALVVIFGENFLLENKILKEEDIKNISDFNTGEKNYELIVFVDDGIPTFSHRTYAEYFAALKIYEYLKEKKFHILYEQLFKEEFQGVRAMFDRISAKKLPLHLEVVEEDFDKVERLCDDLSSSKIHERDEFGRTVLHFAMNSCKFSDLPVEENVPVKIVDLLMRHCKKDKAIFKERDGILHLNFYEHAKKCERVNLLHLAAYHGSRNIVECLVDMKDANIDFNIKSETGKTPIHCAAENGFFDIVTLLKDNGGNIDETDQDGLTVLHRAIYKQNEECVDLLIKAGADVNYKTKDERAPIHCAAEKYLLGQGSDIIKLLKEKGGRIDDVDLKGMTPLHCASESGLQHCVDCLKNEGANLNPKENEGRTPMHLAAKNGHVDVMKVLNKEDEMINEEIINDTDSKGWTALHYASDRGHEDCVQYLISKGADVNKKTNCSDTPMHIAARRGYLDVIRLLKDNGGIIDEVDRYGISPLHYAARTGRIDCFKCLTESGADASKIDAFGSAPIHYAAEYGNVDVIKHLIKHENVNICDVDSEGIAAMHYAAHNGRTKCLDFLLEAGADVNQKTKEGRTPMHLAAMNGNVDVMKVLQKEDEIINEKVINDTDSDGWTALHYASDRGHEDCVQYLISKDADVNKKTKEFDTPMHIAVRRGYVGVIRLLKDNDAIIDEVDENELTPLHYAAKTGRIDCFKCLTESGADTSKSDAFGSAPIHYAAEYGKVDVIEYLINHENVNVRVSSNEKSRDGRTPMHYAAENGHVDVIESLKEKGGNIYGTDSMGMTPLHCASQNGRTKCVEYLLKENLERGRKEQDGKPEDIDGLKRYVNRKSVDDRTPLHYAASKGHLGTVGLLLKDKDVRIDDTDSVGLTAFHLAVLSERTDCLNLLMKAGADVNKAAPDGATPLHSAALGGYVDVIRLLKDKGGIINEVDRYGLTPLHYAARTGRIDCFEFLTESDEDFYISDPLGMTPIHYAAENGHLDVIKYLKHKNVNITGTDSEGLTALHYATRNGKIKCVGYLIEEKLDVNKSTNLGETPMSYAVRRNYVNVISLLIEKGARIDDLNSEGLTVLHCAAQHGCKHSLAFLLEAGASSNLKSLDGRTPMHYAAENGHVDIIKLLKKKGAKIDAVDSKGLIPLHYAALEGNIKCINHLIKSSEDINKKAIDGGGTPVHFSAAGGHVDVLKSLKEKGGNIYETDSLGQTALHYASCKGQTKCVKYLLGQCLDVNGKDSNDKTPMHCAAENGHVEVTRVLKEKNGNVNETDMLGRTPLYYATINGLANCMKYLIRAGANIHQKTCDGSTLLSLAVENGHTDAVKLLEDEGAIV